MNNCRFIGINLFSVTKIVNQCVSKPFLVQYFYRNFGFSSAQLKSTTSPQSEESSPKERKYRKPVDWLPFQWHRRPMFNIYEQSGDKIKENIIDLSLPKPDFELSDELKTAHEQVKKLFSLETASQQEIKEVCRRHVLKRVQRHPVDFYSLEVKIAEKTIRIRGLFEYRKQFGRKDTRYRRIIFPILIQRRNKLLKQLRKIDNERFNWLLEELQLYFEHKPLGVLHQEMYCKKWDLRRLTKEYAQNLVASKKTAYYEELKKEQKEFLEEKKKILAWIQEEEKILK